MKTLIIFFALVISASGQSSYYTDIFEGVKDAMDWYYGGTPSSGSIPTAPTPISSTNTPLEDISDKIGTTSGLTSSADGLSSQFSSLDNNFSSIGGMADAATATIFTLPTDTGNLTEHSLGTFVIGGNSVNFKLDFTAWSGPIALVRGLVLLVMTVGFAIVSAETIRGYL